MTSKNLDLRLPPEIAENGLLSTITTPQHLLSLPSLGIDESSFVIHADVFRYIRDYYQSYQEIPSKEDIESVHDKKELKLIAESEFKYYASEVYKIDLIRNAQVQIADRFGEKGIHLYRNPEETIRLVIDDLQKLNKVSNQHLTWYDRDALDRLELAKNKAEMIKKGGVVGIPTGLMCFDNVGQGWASGEAVMVMASKGVGKSWLAIYFGGIGWEFECKVLFLSPEMASQEVAFRLDTLLAYRLGEQLSHSAILSGTQDLNIYEKWLHQISKRDRFIIVDSPDITGFTTHSILNLINTHNPDLVILDGIHLVGSDVSSTGWERIKYTADALKAVAQYKQISVIWTSQVDREAMRNPTEPAFTGASAAYGKAAVEAANRLITLARHDKDDTRRVFRVPNNRNGKEYHLKQHLSFDVDIGRIFQMPTPQNEDYEGIF